MLKRVLSQAVAFCLCCAIPASAQYFGRNKVQYEDLEFAILATPHFDLYYYPSERDAAAQAGRMAERWYDRLSRVLEHQLTSRTPIVLYASHSHFSQTTVAPVVLAEGVGGFTDHLKGRVVFPFTPGLRETDHVLGHELVHAFQRDILQQAGRSMATLPLWFIEGMAEHLSVGDLDANTAMWIRDAILSNRLPTIRQLDEPRWFPYRYGQALWAFLAGKFGADLPARTLKWRGRGRALDRITAATGVDAVTLSREWHAFLRDTARPRRDGRPERALIGTRTGGRVNIGPSVSPDGRYLVFLSERDQYSIDVFLADAETGEVIRKLVTTAGNPRFDSVQFIESAGAWDAGSARFAFTALQNGQAVLTILDLPSGRTQSERTFDDLDHIYDPTWSPEGDRIAFSALRGGRTDLFVLDLAENALRQLTDDGFADLQPAWSPDGRTLAFATDRFTASLDALTFGDYRLGTIDVESGAVHELPSVPDAKNIDPQWAGSDLYFVADPGGVSNVFRIAGAIGEIEQLTDVATGVSGMTALSPTLSVAPEAGRVVFSVYRNGGYEIQSAPLGEGRDFVVPPPANTRAAALPAAPAGTHFEAKPYQPSLSLDRISQPYLTAGGGALGGFFRAGVSFSFSDLLEEQQVQTAVQAGTRLRDLAVQSAYVNRRSRWTWGFGGGQLPAAFVRSHLAAGDESDAPITRERVTLLQTHRQASAVAAYPFSRANRVEFSGGFHGISFSREVKTSLYAPATGRLIEEREHKASAAPRLALFEASAALVHDTSLHGPTGPVLGGRSRLEVAPTLGDLSFLTITGDHRRYFMPVQALTLAVRVQHVGRYGSGSTDPRLLPLVWTLRDLVRGYTTRDAAPDACGAAAASCSLLGDFAARRLLVSNIELRFPLIGPTGSLSRSITLPIDAIAFADAGAFWSRPSGADVTIRRTLRSVGAGVRLNAGGFVLELGAARPFERPDEGWTVAVNFRPGF